MFEIFLSPTAWFGALGIFALRVSDMSCDTLRMLFVVRGRKVVAWGLGFVQSVIFVIAITSVLQHLDNPLNVIGYAAGFATGNVVGMLIEERLAIGHVKVSIVTQRLGTALSQVLRDSGFGVTEIPARRTGRDGKHAERQRPTQGCIQSGRHRPRDRRGGLCHFGRCAPAAARVLAGLKSGRPFWSPRQAFFRKGMHCTQV